MRHPLLRLAIVLAAVAAMGAAGYEIVRLEQQKHAATLWRNDVEDRARALGLLLGDIRAGQHSYVAAGQGQEFWTAQVTSMLVRFDERLSQFRRAVRTNAAASALADAAAAMETFKKIDTRAQDHVRARQELLASDLIFAEGLEAARTISLQLEASRAAEAVGYDRMTAQLKRQELWWLGGATAGALIALLLLARMPAAREAQTVVASREPAAVDWDDRDLRAPTPPAISQPPAVPDLAAAASLCTDLARVLETRELRTMLERAASLLDARGIVLWIADRTGAELRPALAHGYPEDALERMGPIPRDAHNAAAAAFRTGQLRTVPGEESSNGAIVAPLTSPGGCLGVMAIEARNGGERNDAVCSLTAILAAQLSTLVSTVPGTSNVAQQAQG